MEGKDWVLVSKEDAALFIQLSFSKVGRSTGLGRPVWSWVEDFGEASGFDGYADVANAVKKHKIPIHNVKLKPYTNAFSEWTQRPPRNNLT